VESAKINETNDRLLRDIAHQAAALKAELEISLLKGSCLFTYSAVQLHICNFIYLLLTCHLLMYLHIYLFVSYLAVHVFIIPLVHTNINTYDYPRRCENIG
jgi:hypothetical protein